VTGYMRRGTFVKSAAATFPFPPLPSRRQANPRRPHLTTVEHINPESMHKSPVFSQGIVVPAGARTLIIGGQNGVDETGKVVSNDLAGQAAKAVDNLIKVLETAGATLDDLVRVGLYIKGEGDITPGFNEWTKRAGEIRNPPTVTVMRVLGLATPDFLIEIEATAVLRCRGFRATRISRARYSRSPILCAMRSRHEGWSGNTRSARPTSATTTWHGSTPRRVSRPSRSG